MTRIKVSVVTGIVGFVLMAGCNPYTPPPVPAPVDLTVECVNIDRAFAAWASRFLPLWTPTDVRTMTQATMTAQLEEIGKLLDAVDGYPDIESMQVVVAVTRYEADLAMANAERNFYQQPTIETAEKTFASYESVHASYQHFRDTTCRGVTEDTPSSPTRPPSSGQARA